MLKAVLSIVASLDANFVWRKVDLGLLRNFSKTDGLQPYGFNGSLVSRHLH